jgi:hypothetical protein
MISNDTCSDSAMLLGNTLSNGPLIIIIIKCWPAAAPVPTHPAPAAAPAAHTTIIPCLLHSWLLLRYG